MENKVKSLRPIHYGLAFFAGILFVLGFPTNITPSLFPLNFLGTGIILYFLNKYAFNRQINTKQIIIIFLFYSLGTTIFGYSWVSYTLNEFGHLVFPFNYVLSLLMALIIFPQYWFLILILFIYRKLNKQTDSYNLGTTPIQILFLSIILTLLEYYVPQQFPTHISHTWLAISPYLGLAPIFGTPIYSFISYWFICAIISFLEFRKIEKIPLISFLAFLALNIIFPIKNDYPNNSDQIKFTNIRVVQANIGNILKLQSENGILDAVQTVTNSYKDLSMQDYNEGSIDLTVWPETAFPYPFIASQLLNNPALTPQLFKDIISKHKTEILFGGYERVESINDFSYESEYNIAAHLNRDSSLENLYRKRKLIPFGETLPFPKSLKQIASKYITNISYFAAGETFDKFTLQNGTTFITPICYEVLFTSFMRDYLNSFENRPDFIINLTNDSWYGDSFEPHQHLFLAKWRALEFNIPIVRSTNTGITTVIYPDGSESRRLNVGDKGNLDVKLTIYGNKKTFYQHYGILILLIVFLILTGLVYSTSKIRPKTFL